MKTQKLINYLVNKEGCGYDKGKRTLSRNVGGKIHYAKIATSEANDIQEREARPLLKDLGFTSNQISQIISRV